MWCTPTLSRVVLCGALLCEAMRCVVPLLPGYGIPPSVRFASWLASWLAMHFWVGCCLVGLWAAKFVSLVGWLVGWLMASSWLTGVCWLVGWGACLCANVL